MVGAGSRVVPRVNVLGQYEIVQFNEYNGSVVSLLFMGRMSLLMHYNLIGQRTQIPLPSRDGSTRPDRFGTLSSSCPLRTWIGIIKKSNFPKYDHRAGHRWRSSNFVSRTSPFLVYFRQFKIHHCSLSIIFVSHNPETVRNWPAPSLTSHSRPPMLSLCYSPRTFRCLQSLSPRSTQPSWQLYLLKKKKRKLVVFPSSILLLS